MNDLDVRLSVNADKNRIENCCLEAKSSTLQFQHCHYIVTSSNVTNIRTVPDRIKV